MFYVGSITMTRGLVNGTGSEYLFNFQCLVWVSFGTPNGKSLLRVEIVQSYLLNNSLGIKGLNCRLKAKLNAPTTWSEFLHIQLLDVALNGFPW